MAQPGERADPRGDRQGAIGWMLWNAGMVYTWTSFGPQPAVLSTFRAAAAKLPGWLP